ncbi:unnamed protein product [Arctia plantaginis]|uniref:Major facilitator superfamily (MFS) profile domain-containing protein n=1 Tax=Arctia plantaginis TaxID=874455 RepID=A0A8S1AG79_ARCPL|nr:unnamed protein product [Arctia plantaginis]
MQIFSSFSVIESIGCNIVGCDGITNDTSWLQFAIPQLKTGHSKCSKYSFTSNFKRSNKNCDSNSFNTSVQEKCSSFIYNGDSVVRDFNLGCENWKRTLIGTFHNAGLFISLPLTGIISDKYGRKLALSVAALMNGIFGLLRSFSVNYYMLITLEFMEAACGAGAYTTAFVLAMELVRPKGRVFGNTLINVVFVFGLMSLAGLSWLLKDWRTLLRVMYTPSCFIFSYLWILNESVRWLLSKGRNEEALEILQKAAKMNKIELSDQALAPLNGPEKETLDGQKIENAPGQNKVEETSVFMRAVRSSIIRKRVMTCSFLWITCTFVYYGLSINSVSLAGNVYVNFMLVSFIEIPANFCCLFVLDRFGRKKVLITTYILSAILCISLSFLPKDLNWWRLSIYLSGKFSITVAYSSVYIYVSEVFPTNVRQSLLAICSSTGRVGSTLAPLTPLLALYYENLPSIFFGTLAIVAGIFVFTLPETLNQPLPDSIEDAERLNREKQEQKLIA